MSYESLWTPEAMRARHERNKDRVRHSEHTVVWEHTQEFAELCGHELGVGHNVADLDEGWCDVRPCVRCSAEIKVFYVTGNIEEGGNNFPTPRRVDVPLHCRPTPEWIKEHAEDAEWYLADKEVLSDG